MKGTRVTVHTVLKSSQKGRRPPRS
ncbi:MAG: hypothetical protein M3541_21690 [Acidobacteriota bacterium]|nr:hypothetical protein [Acidobacteriota bacterium]